MKAKISNVHLLKRLQSTQTWLHFINTQDLLNPFHLIDQRPGFISAAVCLIGTAHSIAILLFLSEVPGCHRIMFPFLLLLSGLWLARETSKRMRKHAHIDSLSYLKTSEANSPRSVNCWSWKDLQKISQFNSLSLEKGRQWWPERPMT